MPELVRIPVSVFELTADYIRPDFRLWSDRATVLQGVFDALLPWGAQIDKVEAATTGPTSQQGFTITLPAQAISFFFGAASCRFTKQYADWDTAEETFEILKIATSALVSHGNVELRTMNAAIFLHLQLHSKSVHVMDILAPFVPSRLSSLEVDSMDNLSTIVKWPHRRVTIEGSVLVANAVFLRFDREFAPSATYVEMKQQLLEDRDELFRILGVKEDVE